MKTLKVMTILFLVSGIALAGLGAYGYFFNEDKARAARYAAEQQKVLAEAFRAKGTPRERELMKEYGERKDVTELAWKHARQTSQTAMLLAGGGLALIVASLLILSLKRIRAPSF